MVIAIVICAKCVDEHEVEGILWCMGNFGRRQTNSGEGTVRAKFASAITQISDEARAETSSFALNALSPTFSSQRRQPCHVPWSRYSYGSVSKTSPSRISSPPGFWLPSRLKSML